MIEFRLRARLPRTPMSSAAASEPASEPSTTPMPKSRPAAAPAKDSSLIAWTAKARSRAITKTPIMPPVRPRTAPAMIELRTRASSSP